MRRIYALITVILVSISAFHCQREVSNGGLMPGLNGNTSTPITATLQGNVFNEIDQPAAGVNIKVGNKTAITDAQGYFRIEKATLDKNASTVQAEKNGYFKTYRTFSATSGVNQVVIKLIRKSIAGTVNAGAGGDVTLSNGAKIALPANGIVKAAGGTYTGTVNVYAAYIDPTATDVLKTVPGSFLANDKDNKRVMLSSYGMLAVELESASGEKLQIASGNTATLISPIPTDLLAKAPSTIKLWYVDEQTGIWKEEGEATKTGNNYVGQVKHFTYWNCDVAGAVINLTTTIKTQNGLPMAYASIAILPVATDADSSYYGGCAHGYTDSLGQINGPVPANRTLLLQVLGPCNNVIYSQHIGPFSSDVSLPTITVSLTSAYLTTISGKIVDCNNSAVSNGFAVIVYDYMKRYVRTNSNGEFISTFTSCVQNVTTCNVSGVDIAAQQEGTSIDFALPTSNTNVGTIVACGTLNIESINYTLDGTDYTISSLNGDSLSAYDNHTPTTTPTRLQVGGSRSGANIYLDIAATGAAGTYPVTILQVQNNNNLNLGTPFNTVITNYPQAIGEFYTGTFSGQFTYAGSPSVNHTISGSFRLRKYY
ncbi:MAG: hypothetical protein ABI480_06585 [Chitinophagaceae bacterium]